jgi:hypothetical protein
MNVTTDVLAFIYGTIAIALCFEAYFAFAPSLRRLRIERRNRRSS